MRVYLGLLYIVPEVRGNATGDVEVAQEWSEDSGHMHWLELTRRLLEHLEDRFHVISACILVLSLHVSACLNILPHVVADVPDIIARYQPIFSTYVYTQTSVHTYIHSQGPYK